MPFAAHGKLSVGATGAAATGPARDEAGLRCDGTDTGSVTIAGVKWTPRFRARRTSRESAQPNGRESAEKVPKKPLRTDIAKVFWRGCSCTPRERLCDSACAPTSPIRKARAHGSNDGRAGHGGGALDAPALGVQVVAGFRESDARSPASTRWRLTHERGLYSGQRPVAIPLSGGGQRGRPIDFLLCARRFFVKSHPRRGTPKTVTVDKSGAHHAALQALGAQREPPIVIRRNKYLNHLVEQDHRAIQWRVRPMLGFQNFRCARIGLGGLETMHMMHKGQRLAPKGTPCLPCRTMLCVGRAKTNAPLTSLRRNFVMATELAIAAALAACLRQRSGETPIA